LATSVISDGTNTVRKHKSSLSCFGEIVHHSARGYTSNVHCSSTMQLCRPSISYFRLVQLLSCEALGVKGQVHIDKLQRTHR